MSIFEYFDIEKIGTMLPSAESLMENLSGWTVLLVLIGPLLMLGFGLYYLFLSPKEANHSIGYRFSYAMSRMEVWQHAQRLAGIAYAALGGILFLIVGIICLRFGKLAPPDMVWLAAKCLLWEVVLAISATLAVNIWIIVLYDIKGNPRPLGDKLSQKLRKPKRTPKYGTTAKRPRR